MITSRPSLRVIVALGGIASAVAGRAGSAQESAAAAAPPSLDETFAGPDWDRRWRTARLARRANVHAVVNDGGDRALQVQSRNAASALIHPVDLPGAAIISWRWRVDTAPWDNRRERERGHDDYGARVFVIFGSDLTDPDVRALCYVWAADEAVGAVYPSPYATNVATIVLRRGASAAGGWRRERRSVTDDYRRAFGADPERGISAVALMVDTDDTRSEAVAWFDDIRLTGRP